MASFTVPCPKNSAVFVGASSQSRHQLPPQTSGGFKVSAQLNEVSAIEKSTNSHLATEEEVPKAMADATSISAFLSQAANLVKLVDSKDIVEVQLKQMECEILIRKKEALSPMNITAAPVSTAQPAFLQPMVGDKIKKGQVVCIIEAMKLMNEIEAEQSGTVVEIVVEDGKPVSVDMVSRSFSIHALTPFNRSHVLYLTSYLPLCSLYLSLNPEEQMHRWNSMS
nr:biotin carboxyl carrier protein of acetyl-CoA carboxylase 1, chloroplastic-like [Ipomoea batatas]